jgi:hypothetical protein
MLNISRSNVFGKFFLIVLFMGLSAQMVLISFLQEFDKFIVLGMYNFDYDHQF